MPSLPLFPLGTVLYPGARLPLRIFEPRYLAMLDDLTAGSSEPVFGVVAIRRGHEVGAEAALDLFGVGCEARIDALVAAGGAGVPGAHLVATGARRFLLDRVDTGAGTAYVTGVVTYPAEPDGNAVLESLVEQVLTAHAGYLRAIGAEPVVVEAHPRQLAYRVAEAMAIDLRDRQSVLEAPDPGARLRAVRALLRRETALVRGLRALPIDAPLGGAGLN